MDMDVIKSYLVSLGFKVDNASLSKMQATLKDLSKSVENHTSGMSKSFVGAAGVIVGAIASITAATAGLMDHLAQTDLQYQKFAFRMFTSVDFAKRLKIATDALGESMEDIAWIPEIRGRYSDLMELQKRLATPGGYEAQMKYLRDVRHEFTKLKVEMAYGAQWVGSYLFKYLNAPIRNLHGWLARLNEKIEKQMPVWTEKVARWLTTIIQVGGHAVQAIGDLWSVAEKFWGQLSPEAKTGGLIGSILGFALIPGPLQGLRMMMTLLSALLLLLDDFYVWKKGGKSLLGDFWKDLSEWSEKTGKSFGNLADAINKVFAIFQDRNKLDKTKDSLKQTTGYFNELANAIGRAVERMMILGDLAQTLDETLSLLWHGQPEEAKKRWRQGMKDYDARVKNLKEAFPDGTGLDDGSGKYMLPGAKRAWAEAISKQESGGNYKARNSDSGAYGKYQIMPGTWRIFAPMAGLSPTAPMTPANQEVVAEVMHRYYMARYGDERLVAAAWYGGQGVADKLKKGALSKEAFTRRQGGGKYPSIKEYIEQTTGTMWHGDLADYDSTVKNFRRYSMPNSGAGASNDNRISVGDVNVSVTQPNATAEDIALQVREKIAKEVREDIYAEMDRANAREAREYAGAY